MGLRDFFTSISSLFYREKEQTGEPTKRGRRQSIQYDYTDSLQCNAALTQGLYHNSYPGLKLAGSMAFNPIAVPVWFMGLPVPRAADESEATQAVIDELVEQNVTTMLAIHTISHRDGTCWVWPTFSSKFGRVVWVYIPDEVVTDIVRDLATGEIVRLIADEEIVVSVDFGVSATIHRRRIWTPQEYTVEWSKGTPAVLGELVSGSARNVLGVMPIAFSNNRDLDMVRGHSDYERILPDLKAYHDVDLANSTVLAQFRPKLVQTTKNVDQWMANNSFDEGRPPDVSRDDLILNLPEEKSEYIFPQGATEAYEADLKRRYKKIVEGSAISEILWGVKTEGNHASAEEQMGVLVKFINDKQTQKNEPYRLLFAASLALLGSARMQRVDVKRIRIEWNPMDAISEKVKSDIFRNFAAGMAALMNVAGITMDQAHKLWNELYPSATDDDFEKFTTGLEEMSRHRQFTNTPWEMALDATGASPGPDGDIDENKSQVQE